MARIFETTKNATLNPQNVGDKLYTPSGPLESLESIDKGSLDLMYPRDLHSSNRAHTVQFFINQPENSTYLQNGTTTGLNQSYLFGSDTTLFKDLLVGATTGAVGGAIAGINLAYSTRKANLQLVAATALGGAVLGAGLVAGNPAISPKQVRLMGSIQLFMPDTVNITTQQSYQEDNMSDYTIPYYGSLGKSIMDTATNSLGGDTAGTKLNPITQTANFLAGVRSSLGKLLPANALLKGQGAAVNPQVQLLFKATALRSFQMEFMFSPKRPEESYEVQQIIKTFKFYSSPEVGGTQTVGGVGSGLFFVVPATFNIVYNFQGKENLFVNRIGECVLESVNVDYAPNGWSTFNDGSPTQIRMTLQFKETTIVDKNKVMQGY